MGYIYTCDSCGETEHERPPPFMGEFRESFLKTVGGEFMEAGYDIGQTVTICQPCCEEVLL